jgi:hypothetical protein
MKRFSFLKASVVLLRLGQQLRHSVRVHRLDKVVIEPCLPGTPAVFFLAPAGQGHQQESGIDGLLP